MHDRTAKLFAGQMGVCAVLMIAASAGKATDDLAAA